MGALELPVVAFLQGIEEIRGAMLLAVVLDLLIALHLDFAAVLEGEHVSGVLQVGLLDEHALESFGVEAEGRAAFQALLMGVEVNVLELIVLVVGRDIRGL